MFKSDLKARLERIFGVSKTTFDAPSMEAPEQDTLFIDVAEVRARMCTSNEGGRSTAKVEGAVVMFSQAGRTPFGFFAKRIEQADAADKSTLFFSPEQDVASSPVRMINLHERRVPFTFFYDSQYDPARGDLTSLDVSFTMEV